MILLTGASGVVGSAVMAHEPSLEILALCHKRPIDKPTPTLVGDITKTQLGLDARDYKALCERLTTVIHAAAVVGLASTPEEYQRVNVMGTRHVAQLAEDAGAALVYVSTAFATPAPTAQHEPATYEQSKWLAEEIVRASGVPRVIVSPSIVIGDSRSGDIAEEQGIHKAIAKLVEGPVRVVPGDENMVVDFVAQDHLAAVIAGATKARPSQLPTQLWITSGAEALTIGELVHVVNEFLEDNEIPGERVRAMPFDKVERLVIPILPPRLRAEMRGWLHLARHVSAVARFPCSNDVVEQLFDLRTVAPRAALDRNLSAWWARRWSGESRYESRPLSHEVTSATLLPADRVAT